MRKLKQAWNTKNCPKHKENRKKYYTVYFLIIVIFKYASNLLLNYLITKT